MDEVLLALLRALAEVEASHEGLGKAAARERMMADLFRGFLRPEPEFLPTNQYGLSEEANQWIGMILQRFCVAANSVARELGMTTFHQRLAAVQNPELEGDGGVYFEDYFGYYDAEWFDEEGNDVRNSLAMQARASLMSRGIRRACAFEWATSLEELLDALNRSGVWIWRYTNRGPQGESALEAKPLAESRVRICHGLETLDADGLDTTPSQNFIALIESTPTQIEFLDRTFRVRILNLIGAREVAEVTVESW